MRALRQRIEICFVRTDQIECPIRRELLPGERMGRNQRCLRQRHGSAIRSGGL